MTGDNSDTTLTLSVAPVHENNVQVYFDGVYQSKSNYTISGTTLTFSTAPPTGVLVEAITNTNTSSTTANILLDADSDTKIQVEESSDEDKIRFDTGGTERLVLDSSALASTVDVTTAGSFLATGDVAAGDDAAIGYNSTQGLILTGQGSSQDVTIKNDANAKVFSINTGTTEAIFEGKVGIGTASPTSYYSNTLHLYGSASANIKLSNSDTGSTNGDGVDLALDDSEDFRIIQREAKAVQIYTSATLAQTIDADGHITMPKQPAFQAIPATSQSDIAANTNVTIVFGTELFDVGSNFASNTFTAPVTGKYQFNVNVRLDNMDSAATYYIIYIVTSNRNYYSIQDPSKYSGDPGYESFNLSVLADMDASDTALVRIYQSGGTAQTDIAYNSGGTQFSGILVA
jgi:hypothetical protein